MVDIQASLESSCGYRRIGINHVGISTANEILNRAPIQVDFLSHERHGGVARNTRGNNILPAIQVIQIEYDSLSS